MPPALLERHYDQLRQRLAQIGYISQGSVIDVPNFAHPAAATNGPKGRRQNDHRGPERPTI
jgi:hypothetical protein